MTSKFQVGTTDRRPDTDGPLPRGTYILIGACAVFLPEVNYANTFRRLLALLLAWWTIALTGRVEVLRPTRPELSCPGSILCDPIQPNPSAD